MNSVENISKKARYLNTKEYQNFIDSYKGNLIEMVEEGEKFLQQYGTVKGIGSMDNKQIEDLLKDIEMSKKSERTTQYHLMKSFINGKYKYIFPKESSPSEERTGMAYAIGLRIFRSKLPMNQATFSFEIPCTYSISLTPIEEAFIYSLLVPYKEYKKCMEKFITERRENGVYSMNIMLADEWIQYVSSRFSCDFRYTTVAIERFYRFLYFEEIEKIWKEEIYRTVMSWK